MKNVYFINSTDTSVYNNLAVENSLFEEISRAYCSEGASSAALMLWQNSDCVVIGKNQNPYRECDLKYMEENGILLSRRTTGGGAVFHDGGNLNFTFILSSDVAEGVNTFDILTEAFISLGIPAELSGRNDILVDGRKFSGNAFRTDKGAYMHHGTVLINASSEKMLHCLTPSKPKLASKGVASVAARTVNLNAIYPCLTARQTADAVSSVFLSRFGTDIRGFNADIGEKAKELSSREWLYGGFTDVWTGNTFRTRFSWGTFEMTVCDGQIVSVSSDALDTELIAKIRNGLPSANGTDVLGGMTAETEMQKKMLGDISVFMKEIL